jgi:TonB family protein
MIHRPQLWAWWTASAGLHAALLLSSSLGLGLWGSPPQEPPEAKEPEATEVVLIDAPAPEEEVDVEPKRDGPEPRRVDQEARRRKPNAKRAGRAGKGADAAPSGGVTSVATQARRAIRAVVQAESEPFERATPAPVAAPSKAAAPVVLLDPTATSRATAEPGAIVLALAEVAAPRPEDEGLRPRFANIPSMASTAGADPAPGAGDPEVAREDEALRLDAELMRKHPYWRRVYERIDALWEFPREAELAGRQGTVRVAFRLDPATGGLTSLRVLKSSRIPGFDSNVKGAIQAAAPFGPIPDGSPGRGRMPEAMFRFRNPVVR